jgi:hypothetical protein
VLGLALRVAFGGGGVGERSATLLAFLLTLGGFAAARLVASPRVAFSVGLALVALFDLAALGPRNPAGYDDVQAFYRTDQSMSVQLPVDGQRQLELVLVAQPMYTGDQPAFGLAGDVNETPLQWSCTVQHGVQRLELPLPAEALRGATTADVRLRLTGSPSHASDYLLVYASSRHGGVLMTLEPQSHAPACALK